MESEGEGGVLYLDEKDIPFLNFSARSLRLD